MPTKNRLSSNLRYLLVDKKKNDKPISFVHIFNNIKVYLIDLVSTLKQVVLGSSCNRSSVLWVINVAKIINRSAVA